MKLIILFLISFNLLAQSVNPNNTLKIGDGTGSAVDKGLVFDTGDGVNNKVLKVDDTGKLKFSGNEAQLGDGTSSNSKTLTIDSVSGAALKWDGTDQFLELNHEAVRIGNGVDEDIALEFSKGGSNPQIIYDSTKGKIRFSNDGASYKDIGSGGGGGGGESFNNAFTADDNANAEDGATGWSTFGGPSFDATTVDPLEGDSSFEFDSSAQNDYVESPILDLDKDIFKGRSCQASIEYIGGDANLTLKVLNANDVVLGSLVLPAHTRAAQESVFFLCPSDSEITGDADKGLLRLRIENVGVTQAALIKFDKAYIGTLIGLSESVLPDFGSVRVSGACAITSQIGDFVASATSLGTGNCRLTFKSNEFTVIPTVTISVSSGSTAHRYNIQTLNNSTSLVEYLIKNDATATATEAHVTIAKQGADAKQSVQVYKSIPKVAQNANEFTFKAVAAGTVSDESLDFINGNAVVSDTSLFTYTFNTNIFTAAPNCIVSGEQPSTSVVLSKIVSVSSTTLVIRTYATPNTLAPYNHQVICQKSTIDYKMPTVQPVIVGQVANSAAESNSSNVRVESCAVTNAGSPTVQSANGLCSSWISSLSLASTGRVDLVFISGIFSTVPVCTSDALAAGGTARTTGLSATTAQVRTSNTAGSDTNYDFTIVCVGKR